MHSNAIPWKAGSKAYWIVQSRVFDHTISNYSWPFPFCYMVGDLPVYDTTMLILILHAFWHPHKHANTLILTHAHTQTHWQTHPHYKASKSALAGLALTKRPSLAQLSDRDANAREKWEPLLCLNNNEKYQGHSAGSSRNAWWNQCNNYWISGPKWITERECVCMKIKRECVYVLDYNRCSMNTSQTSKKSEKQELRSWEHLMTECACC